jgi:hypothetical protein
MLRAIILALILFVAFGTIVPIATEYAEAGAEKLQIRKKKKERRAKKYRKYITRKYTKRSRRAKRYKKSNRYKKSRRYRSSKRYRQPKRYRAKRKTRKTRSTKRYRSSKRYRKSRKYKSSKRYRSAKYRKARKKKRTRKYSSKWMRSYRAKKSRQRAIAKRKRNMRLKRIRLAKQKRQPNPYVKRSSQSKSSQSFVSQQFSENQINTVQTVSGNGDVSLEVIGPAVGETTTRGRNTTVGGVSTTALRRTVIDKMIQENGWVENDYQKDIGGKKVYVVVAKSADKNNRIQSQTFYFTESNGQIYRVASKATKESSEQVVRKSEKIIQTLPKPAEIPQQAQNQ